MKAKLAPIITAGAIGLVAGASLAVWLADDLYTAMRIPAGWTPTILLDEDNAMRELVRTGKIRSPQQLIEQIELAHDGHVHDVDFDRGFLSDTYEFELIDQQRREWEIEVDAVTGKVLNKQREWD